MIDNKPTLMVKWSRVANNNSVSSFQNNLCNHFIHDPWQEPYLGYCIFSVVSLEHLPWTNKLERLETHLLSEQVNSINTVQDKEPQLNFAGLEAFVYISTPDLNRKTRKRIIHFEDLKKGLTKEGMVGHELQLFPLRAVTSLLSMVPQGIEICCSGVRIVLSWRNVRFHRCRKKPSQNLHPSTTKSRNSWEMTTARESLSQGYFVAMKKTGSWHWDEPAQTNRTKVTLIFH